MPKWQGKHIMGGCGKHDQDKEFIAQEITCGFF